MRSSRGIGASTGSRKSASQFPSTLGAEGNAATVRVCEKWPGTLLPYGVVASRVGDGLLAMTGDRRQPVLWQPDYAMTVSHKVGDRASLRFIESGTRG